MKKIENSLLIKELVSIDEIEAAYPLIHQVRDQMSFETYISYFEEMKRLSNFKIIAAIIDEKIVGLAGYWMAVMLYCGRYIQISNLVVDQNFQSRGIAKKILYHIEKIGKELGCSKIVLDSYVENKRSHPFFFREGFHIRGFHFMKDVS